MNKLAFITGSTKRIGKHLAEVLAKNGYSLILHYNTSDLKARILARDLEISFPQQHFYTSGFDLSNWKLSGAYFRNLVKKFPVPNLIIHNASEYLSGKMRETSIEMMEKMMGIHFFSPFFISQEFVKLTDRGEVIAIVDAQVVGNDTSHAAYLASKKSLTDFIKMSAVEWAPNFRVNGIAPGPVLPPENSESEYFNQVVNNTPLKSQVSLESISSAVLYLINNKSVTGQIMFCDSGQHLIQK